MHDLGEIEQWRRRRDDLLREAEEGRRARRPSSREGNPRSTLVGRLMSRAIGRAGSDARSPLAKQA